MKLSDSEKDHLEAIYVLHRRSGNVRCIDVANYMCHSKPSITRAVSILCSKGYIEKKDNELTFTEIGLAVAENILVRECILTQALSAVGVDDASATSDARRIERAISEETITRAANLIQCKKRQGGACPSWRWIETTCGA